MGMGEAHFLGGDYFRGNSRTLNRFVFEFRPVCTKRTLNED